MAFAYPMFDQDTVIPIGSYMYIYDANCHTSPVNYNVSQFCRTFASDSYRTAHVNTFTAQLDKLMHVSRWDPRYMHIYTGIDTIIGRLMSELATMNSVFNDAKIRHTGSIASNVKVGLPHEADYVCELPQAYELGFHQCPDLFGKEREMLKRFCEMVEWIINHKASTLTKDLCLFKIHGAKSHKTFKGVCLYLQCKSNELLHMNVGVTVDLVFVFVLQGTYSTLTSSAASFLPCGLQTYAQRGMLHRLLGKPLGCDTGLIENEIVAGLPESKQRGFRVAKFMLQNYTLNPIGDYSFDNPGSVLQLDPSTRLGLYGYKPAVSSYKLRIVLLLLLQHVRGRPEENMLNDGVLAICLLDMLNKFANTNKNGLEIHHPFFADRPSHAGQFAGKFHIDKLINYFFERHPQEFSLMNHEHALRVFHGKAYD